MSIDWPSFLRRERARLIEDIAFLETGTIKITRTEAGKVRDMLPEMLETDRRNIAEIESLLNEAGEPLE
jgi:hypothetical protein